MKKLVVAASVAALATGLYAFFTPSRPEAPAHLLDRVWIDHVPRGPTDLVTHLVVLKKPEGNDVGGVIGRSSQWHVGIDIFQRKLDGERMRLFFPQHRRALNMSVRTWKCAGDAPEPFELCLELGHGKDKMRLYSRNDWTINGDLPDFARAFTDVPEAGGANTGEDATIVEVEGTPSLLLP